MLFTLGLLLGLRLLAFTLLLSLFLLTLELLGSITLIVRLNAANGVFLEFVHMQDECGHGKTSLYL